MYDRRRPVGGRPVTDCMQPFYNHSVIERYLLHAPKTSLRPNGRKEVAESPKTHQKIASVHRTMLRDFLKTTEVASGRQEVGPSVWLAY